MLDRPVKICLTREEVFYCHRGRHPVLMQFRTGVKQRRHDHRRCTCRRCSTAAPTARYGVASTFYTGALQTVTYHIPRYRFEGCRVFTNKPPCGPKRGHGTPQRRFGQEVQLDKIAERLGDRSRPTCACGIVAQPDTLTANYLRVGTIGLAECIRTRGRSARGWREQHGKLPLGRGLGLACSSYLSRRRPADLLERHAALRRAAEARSQRRRHRVLRRDRDRPGLGRRAGGDAWRRCSASIRSTSAPSPATPT